MKKVKLTLSRLAVLSAFGLAFAGGCDKDEDSSKEADKKDGKKDEKGALTKEEVQKMIDSSRPAAGGVDLKKALEVAENKTLFDSVVGALVNEHEEVKAWGASKVSLGKLSAKETELLALAADNDKIVRAGSKTEADAFTTGVDPELASVITASTIYADKTKALTAVKGLKFLGCITTANPVDNATTNAAATALGWFGSAPLAGGTHKGHLFAHRNSTGGQFSIYKIEATAVGTGSTGLLLQADGAWAAAAPIGGV